MNVNVWDVVDAIRTWSGRRGPIDLDALADPGTPLDELAS